VTRKGGRSRRARSGGAPPAREGQRRNSFRKGWQAARPAGHDGTGTGRKVDRKEDPTKGPAHRRRPARGATNEPRKASSKERCDVRSPRGGGSSEPSNRAQRWAAARHPPMCRSHGHPGRGPGEHGGASRPATRGRSASGPEVVVRRLTPLAPFPAWSSAHLLGSWLRLLPSPGGFFDQLRTTQRQSDRPPTWNSHRSARTLPKLERVLIRHRRRSEPRKGTRWI